MEQFDSKDFNRGWLFNVGFDILHQRGEAGDCVTVHDVDMLPSLGVDYADCILPTGPSSYSRWKNSIPYNTFAGGVLTASAEHWKRINGFSNEYNHWGGEDDDLYWRFKHEGLLRDNMLRRFPGKWGHIDCILDEFHTKRSQKSGDALKKMLQRRAENKKDPERMKRDGLTNVKYNPGFKDHLVKLQLGSFEVEWVKAYSPDEQQDIGKWQWHCGQSVRLTIFPITIDDARMRLQGNFPSCDLMELHLFFLAGGASSSALKPVTKDSVLASIFRNAEIGTFIWAPEASLDNIGGIVGGMTAQSYSGLHAAVCIVGQQNRLEVPSKLVNLLKANPLFNFYIILLLEKGGANYAVAQNGNLTNAKFCYANTTDYDFKQSATQLFTAYGARSIHIELNEPISWDLTSDGKVFKYNAKFKRSVLNQVLYRQQCGRLILDLEKKQKKGMDIILSMTENAVFTKAFDIKSMFPHILSNVLMKNCFTWGGYNTKFWVVPRHLLQTVFFDSNRDILNGADYVMKKKGGIETVIKNIWTHYKVPIKWMKPSELPVVDGRCRSDGNAALIRNYPFFNQKVTDCAVDFNYEDILSQILSNRSSSKDG